MKLFIASDIHGSVYYLDKMLKAFKTEGAEKLVLLGDILYHGPRNDLPKDYAPKKVIEALNEISEKIICVRGNCDTEVDQMVLDFPILSDYAIIFDGASSIYLTHGHNKDALLPKLCEGDVLISGHTHVPKSEKENGTYHLNPGSVSIPKEGSERGYIVYENKCFKWKNLDGEVYDSLEI